MRMAQYVIPDKMPHDESAEVQVTSGEHETLPCAVELLCPSAYFWLMQVPSRLLSTPSAGHQRCHSNAPSYKPHNAAILMLEATHT